MKLRTRVFDLEQQNRILSLLFQQRVKMSSTPVSQVTTHPACTPSVWLGTLGLDTGDAVFAPFSVQCGSLLACFMLRRG